MSILQCTSCNGVYSTVQSDLSKYFHACPASVPSASARNENVPSTNTNDAGKMTSVGLGTTVPKVVPVSLQALGPA